MVNGTYGSKGNAKLGPRVSVVNRQAGTTCPGKSPWCINCYAEKGNFLRFGLQAKFGAKELSLPTKIHDIFRWHVSGDFDSVEYINMAINYMQAHPETKFFAYTRSWTVPELLPVLETMRALPNMQLFASVDTTMVEPPTGWRVAYIEDDSRFTGMECLEQNGKMPNCQACGYCFRKPKGNVKFLIH